MTKTPDTFPLAEFLATFAVDAVHAQRELDAAHRRGPEGEAPSWDRAMAEMLNSLPPETRARLKSDPAARDLLLETAPRPSRLASWEVDCRVLLSADRERGYGILLRPLSPLWERRYGSSAAGDSRIAIRVEAFPSPTPLSTTHEPSS
jgi:hypothetical protein